MDFSSFSASLSAAAPPGDLAPLLRALWLDAKGDFDGAHAIAQEIDTSEGALVHAYLHRKEGDAPNAGYWYRRARKPIASGSLDEEWAAIVHACL